MRFWLPSPNPHLGPSLPIVLILPLPAPKNFYNHTKFPPVDPPGVSERSRDRPCVKWSNSVGHDAWQLLKILNLWTSTQNREFLTQARLNRMPVATPLMMMKVMSNNWKWQVCVLLLVHTDRFLLIIRSIRWFPNCPKACATYWLHSLGLPRWDLGDVVILLVELIGCELCKPWRYTRSPLRATPILPRLRCWNSGPDIEWHAGFFGENSCSRPVRIKALVVCNKL